MVTVYRLCEVGELSWKVIATVEYQLKEHCLVGVYHHPFFYSLKWLSGQVCRTIQEKLFWHRKFE